MTGIYLKCERCPATIGGEQVTKNPEHAPNFSGGALLRSRAAERGWTNPARDVDLCPECSKQPTNKASESRDG